MGGTFQALNPPFRMSGATAAARPYAAALGEHTKELLAEIGYTPAEIAALVSTATAASPG
jgi:crotonobetainyl-CoA:carnitine CoA-transferase CaiB-like acyl-CoA transferase